MSYWQGPVTDNMATYLQQGIRDYAYMTADALSYFRAFNLIDPVPRGAPKVTTTIFEKMQPGQIGFGLEHVPIAKPHATEKDSTIAVLASIVQLNKLQIDLWREQTSPHIQTGSLIAQAISQQLKAFVQQVDNFLFWGDDMASVNILDNAALLNSGTWTGMLNGFTALAGGTGKDDNVSAANDYWDTVTNMITALKKAGHNSKQYIIFSDLNTYDAAGATHSFYATTGGHENDIVIRRTDVASWVASPNAYDNSGTDYRMCVTTPEFSTIGPKGNIMKSNAKPYRLLMGYNFELVPLFNGGLDMQFNTNIGVLCSLVLEETYATAIQRTGALTH
jgi:hypothetical protein